MSSLNCIELGEGVVIVSPINAYRCKIGNYSKVGPFVEIQQDVEIGEGCTISSHSFICSGVKIDSGTFVGHGVMFINDKFDSLDIKNWKMKRTEVGKGVRIGSNATILPVKIGDYAVIGAGSVVTKDVPEGAIVYGNPAKISKKTTFKR
jgi:acetyltransferase-like isoleucine patch superfamily enzyme